MMKRGDKIYLDKNQEKESVVNFYLGCRDGIVEMYEYNDNSGYGSETKLFYCQDTKHETVNIVRQRWNSFAGEWIEEDMSFDSDSFEFLKGLIKGKINITGGKHSVLRDYSNKEI